jgi:tellurite resistance protein
MADEQTSSVVQSFRLVLQNDPIFGASFSILQGGSRPTTVGEDGAEDTTEDDIRTVQRFQAMIETAFLVAAADDSLTAEEVRALSAALVQLTDDSITEDDISTLLEGFIDLTEEQGSTVRIEQLTEVLTTMEDRRTALAVAVGLMRADGKIVPEELNTFYRITAAFGFAAEDAETLLRQVETWFDQEAPASQTETSPPEPPAL